MKKFDRFIFISLGIWTLAMSQFIKPATSNAAGKDFGTYIEPCYEEVTDTEECGIMLRSSGLWQLLQGQA